MNLARISVHRPVSTVMVNLIAIILGCVALTRLPVDLMPDISYPTLRVSTSYESASPEEIEELVTRPIEEAMSAVPGVEEVSSVSSEGSSSVRVTFSWGTDLDAAANDVRDRLDRVIGRLPDDADRPSLRKFDPASFPILILGASSKLDPIQMRSIIDNEIKYRIERVPGVAALDIRGGLEREIHVDLDPDKLKALGISLDKMISQIKASNMTLPAGVIEAGNYQIALRTPGEYVSLDELRNTTIALRNGVPILLKDVAEVVDKWARITRYVRVNGQSGVRLSVNKQSGTNTVVVAENVMAEIEKINREIPHVQLAPIIDTSAYIRRSISNVGSSTFYGGLFAIVILLFFLRDLRSTAIIAVAIPVSIVATFALIYLGGFTLNLMTLGGLALGVGMLVDNAIVVIESIYSMREKTATMEEAAVKGTEEVAAAVVASTMTTLAVFLPLIFVRGMAGVMFKQLALVVSFALLCSLGVALTLVPMLSARYMKYTQEAEGENLTVGMRLYKATGRIFEELENDYKSTLHFALDHRFLVVSFTILLLGGSLALMPLVGVEMMPESDEGEVRVNLEMEVGTRLGVVDEIARKVENTVREVVPEVANMVTSVGGSGRGGSGSNSAELRISLVSQSQRTRSSETLTQVLRKKLTNLPGTIVRVRAGQGLFLIRRMTGGSERVEVEIRGYDLQTSASLADQVCQVVESIDGVTDAKLSSDVGAPERLIRVDRAKAENMGVTVRQVASVLQTAVSGTRAGSYRDGGDEYVIRVKVKNAEQLSLREILDLTITNAQGQAVVLRNLVNLQRRSGPVSLERKDQERLVTVRANISGRDMGSVIADIGVALQKIPVPQGFAINFGGDFAEQRKAFIELAVGLFLALVLVYMVMACLYESLRDPFVVMFSVPLAIIGVIVMLFVTKTTFNLQSYIGCFMLGGIVVNNAILLVDYTNLLRQRDGMSVREAIAETGRRRLRPILMTTLTTVFGLIPLALGIGEGGEAQAPLARAVIGGLVSSTFITLLFVPVVYSLFEGDEQ